VSERNYVPGSMSFVAGFMGCPVGMDKTFMLTDSEKAEKEIKSRLDSGRHIERAELGLDGDWRENSTEVYNSDRFHQYDAYGGSRWATPTLIIFYTDEPNEAIPCWKAEGK
jgi:hypothetical protein